MHIAIFFAALAGSLIVAVSDRQLRPVALIFSAIMAALLVYVTWDQLFRSTPDAPQMAVDDLLLSDLRIEQDPRLLRVSGRVENGSEEFRLREFTILATLNDCPSADSALAECAVIAQDDGIARVDVPPGQARSFHAVFSFRDVPVPQGETIWDYEIVTLRAVPENPRTSVGAVSR